MTSVHDPAYKRMLQRLREAREAAGLTQAQAAERFGKLQSHIAKIESGERKIDPIELHELAELYGRELGWFVRAE